jgi:hypothetical protein
MRRILIIISLFSLYLIPARAQEFLCDIQVTTRQIEGTDKRVFESLQKALFEFINQRRWTPYAFRNEERIECSMLINITEKVSSDVFKATISVVARRPAYKTSYNTVMLNYIDKDFQFEYVENQNIEFNETTFTDNLTSVIAYYLYIILGLDFDSFSLYGGTPFFEKAEAIVNMAQNTTETGWKAYESQRNRYWMVENYLNNAYSGLRKFMYEYHRKGLDEMSDKVDLSRAKIAESMKLLQQVYNERPGLFVLQLLIDSKRDEFVNIFKNGTPTEKTSVVNILKEIDPANSSSYQQIQSGG